MSNNNRNRRKESGDALPELIRKYTQKAKNSRNVQKSAPKDSQKSTQKNTQKGTQKAAQKNVQKNNQKNNQKNIQKSAQKSAQKNVQKNTQREPVKAAVKNTDIRTEYKTKKSSAGRSTQGRKKVRITEAARQPARVFESASVMKTDILNTAVNMERSRRKTIKSGSKLKIIPLGGLEMIGMNITAFEYEDSIVVVDCGLAFPEDDMPGIDLVIPDVTYLKDNIEKVKGFVITHGHEDHIGALPYVLREVNVPIYSTKLTLALIENKLKEHQMENSVKLKEVRHGQVINLGCFAVEFIKTNHSIQDASALAIYSPVGIIIHTGDFKVDYTPVFGDAIDLQRFAEIGKKGVLALMCDSTNAERSGFTMSERSVGHVFDNLFNENSKSRIIVATFASNVDRVQQIINTAYRFNRKVAVEGRSMVNVISTASELGYLQIPDQTLIEIDEVKNYPDEQMVLITTGSQGESMAALSRMAASIHKKIQIKPNDTIIFSSSAIPGNEKAISKVINELSMKGAKVIFQDVHVSGHACQEEIKLIYSLVRPKYSIPIHGEYRHRIAQKHVVEELGIPSDNIFVIGTGDVLELDQENARVSGKVQTGSIMVDGLGVGDVGNVVLRDRQRLSEDGIIIVVMTLEQHSNVVLSGPDIVSRGFVYVRESEDLLENAREAACSALESCVERNITDWSRIKTEVKDALSDFVWKKTKRSPMILPIIMEA